MIRVTIVHSNEEVRIHNVDTWDEAREFANDFETEHHGKKQDWLAYLGWDFQRKEPDIVEQYGTGYHYVLMEALL